ncbi:hypothetical protein JCM33374_g2279 [Metschnikowia sp. JCM 33374]|nr:hypothetical protein JCM33374_g2279 [Metschnikowia sp. JCM 33374]
MKLNILSLILAEVGLTSTSPATQPHVAFYSDPQAIYPRQIKTATCFDHDVQKRMDETFDHRQCAFPQSYTHEVLMAERRRANEALDRFFKHLKSFVHETVFDVYRFETMGDELSQEMRLISDSVERVASCNKEISDQLVFSTYVFQVMVESIELLKYYESIETAGRHFLCAIIDLNVRLLALHDSHGWPDFKIEGLAVRVYSNTQYLHLLKEGFEASGPETFGKRMMFNSQFRQAESTLNFLACWLPTMADNMDVF